MMNFKRLAVAAAMAICLFVYGWFLSTAGHDHASHSESVGLDHHASISESDYGHVDHDHP